METADFKNSDFNDQLKSKPLKLLWLNKWPLKPQQKLRLIRNSLKTPFSTEPTRNKYRN